MHTILLTGGAGFIGSAFARHVLSETGHRVAVFDALTYSGNLANLEGLAEAWGERYGFVRGDITDAAAVRAAMEAWRPTAIVHMAAESHVDRSIADATPFVRTNVVGTQVLVDAARACGEAWGRGVRFVHVSTDEVYGSLPLDRPDLRFSETSPLRPRSPYAASKAGSDCVVLAAYATHGLDAVVARSPNNFGPRQHPEKLIPLFVTNLLDGTRVPLYGDGRHVRDWIHVEDMAAGVVAALERGRGGEVYNFGADGERSNVEVTRAILAELGYAGSAGEAMIERVADRPGHDLRYAIDWSKAARELGWRPTRSAWPGALARTVAWYREHESWWRPLTGG